MPFARVIALCLLLVAASACSAQTATTDDATSQAVVASPTASPAATVTPAATPAQIVERAHVPVLCYHQIRDWNSKDGPVSRSYTTPPKVFAQQMDRLGQDGYTSISPEQLYEHLNTGTELPTKPVLISFDDGGAGQWENAVPVLKEHDFTATFFVMTVVLDKPGGWLSTEQVRDLDAMGMTIGGHTWDHHSVTQYTEADWETQLTQPQQQLSEIVGHPIRWFAYPFGEWNSGAIPYLETGEVDMAFQLADPIDEVAPIHTIRRMMPIPGWSMDTFANHVAKDF